MTKDKLLGLWRGEDTNDLNSILVFQASRLQQNAAAALLVRPRLQTRAA